MIAHPAHPPKSIERVEVDVVLAGDSKALLTFRVMGRATDLLVPAATAASRTDELWKTTCFELFVMPDGGDGYVEFNFSPSSRWAAYAFDGYREGMRNLHVDFDPVVTSDGGDGTTAYECRAQVDLSKIADVPNHASMSAVIEEKDGTKSFWALHHPLENEPDFHHADCFVLELSATS